MSGTWKFKFWFLVLAIIFAVYMLVPTFMGLKEKKLALEKQGKSFPWYYNILPDEELNLGLDLRGGLYMEMEVGVDDALTHQVDFLTSDIRRLILDDADYGKDLNAEQMKNHRIRVEVPVDKKQQFLNAVVKYFGNKTFDIERERFEVFFEIKSTPEDARKKAFDIVKGISAYDGSVLLSHANKYLALSFDSEDQKEQIIEVLSVEDLASDFSLADQTSVGIVYLTPSEFYLQDIKRNIVNQAANSVRNRIDRFGVAEASVSRQSTDRLVIELPGVKDPDQIIKIVKRTGKLEFRLVDDSKTQDEIKELVKTTADELKIQKTYEEESVAKINAALKSDIPQNTEILFKIMRDPQSKKVMSAIPFLLEKKADVTGDMLDNASVQTRNNMPYVSMSFNKKGTKNFGTLTTNNVGRLLAIVLDGVVTSSPVIRSPITGGQAQIELGIGPYQDLLAEAKEIVMILKEGALPASLAVATKNIIGPSLGHDSIEAGINSMLIAGIAVILFMLAYYKVGGIVANIALLVNVLMVFGILTLFQASLTLPGIAGIVLTVGMAVDANVIIFERMREEKYLGQEVAMVVDSGYGNAMSAIIDSNITTFISGLVLFEFGTGPIKGFATTLMIGIVTTLITAIVLTRVIYDFMIVKMKIKTLRI